MKTIPLSLLWYWVLGAFGTAQAQVYHFPTVYSPAGCAYTYEIAITVRLDSIKVTNIYFDDGTTGSLSFEAYVSYQNVFANSTLPPGNFFTYDIAVFSKNTNLSPQSLTNNVGNVPVQTGGAGGLASQNNPTYNASASALGLVVNKSYSTAAVLSALAYDSATLHINLPCLDTVITTNDSGTLPVLWSGIKGAVKDRQVSLTWQTYMEQNNEGFLVERSADAAHWEVSGFLASKAALGNSQVPIAYQYTCNEPVPGRYYYRVKQRDFDGQSVVSNIIIVSLTGRQGAGSIVVYPNPAKDAIVLKQLAPNTVYTICDTYGRMVQRGIYQNRVDVSKLLSGIYWVRTDAARVRFVVVR